MYGKRLTSAQMGGIFMLSLENFLVQKMSDVLLNTFFESSIWLSF